MPQSRPPDNSTSHSSAWQLASAGTQLAATVGVGAYAGYWLDKTLTLSPWCLLACSLLGSALGLYNFIRIVIKK